MAFIKDSVGQGGRNVSSDVQVIKWMLIRAQSNYGTNLFTATYNFQETGIVDVPTIAGIRDVIAYRIGNSGSILIPPPPPLVVPGGIPIFPNASIAPDDDNYIYLLKCSIKPICFNENNKKIDFHDDPLAVQAITGKLNFQGFKSAVIAKDGDICGESDTNYCGVNPVTGTPGINAVSSGILGELRLPPHGNGHYRSRRGGKHDGIDISCPVGTAIYATQSGVVIELTTTGGFGNRVILKHSDNLFTHYAHLTSFAPGINKESLPFTVREGQLIGYSGRTGNAGGSQPANEDHVHFGVSTSQRPTSGSNDWKNPVTYLNQCVLNNEETKNRK